jgi:hypothetical protein
VAFKRDGLPASAHANDTRLLRQMKRVGPLPVGFGQQLVAEVANQSGAAAPLVMVSVPGSFSASSFGSRHRPLYSCVATTQQTLTRQRARDGAISLAS